MPTATSVNSWTLSNFGPLTTTFTAAPSCSTLFNDILIGEQVADSDTNETFILPFGQPCTIGSRLSVGSCQPSGSLLDNQYKSYWSSPGPRSAWQLNYFSPGLVCPSGYATVGLATKLEGGEVTSSGPAFTYPTTLPTAGSFFNRIHDVGPNVILEAMDAGETAILCCPSGFTAAVGGACTSALPSGAYPIPTTLCRNVVNGDDVTRVSVTLSIFGTVVTGEAQSVTGSEPYTIDTVTLDESTSTETPPSTSAEYVAVSNRSPLYLVHAATDTAASAQGSGSVGSGGNGAGVAFVMVLFSLAMAFTSGFIMLVL